MVAQAMQGMMGMDSWIGPHVERSGEHVPSMNSMQAWGSAWVEEPHPTSLVDEARLFGPNCQDHNQSLMEQSFGTPIKE
jgi:hypothetical protein